VWHVARRHQGTGSIVICALVFEEEIGIECLEKGSLVETAEKQGLVDLESPTPAASE